MRDFAGLVWQRVSNTWESKRSVTFFSRALQKHVEDPLSEAMIQGELGQASLIEIYVDGEELTHRPVDVEEPDDVLLIH